MLKNILIDPVKAWETIDSDNKSVRMIRNRFLFPLLLIVSVSAFGGSLMYVNNQMPTLFSVFIGIKCFFLFLAAFYASSFIVREITYSLDLGRDFSTAFKLTVFSAVPFILIQVLSRYFESLLFANILSLYGLYIFWTGAEKLLDPPAYKKIPLLISTAVTFAAVFFGTDFLFTKIMEKIFFTLYVLS